MRLRHHSISAAGLAAILLGLAGPAAHADPSGPDPLLQPYAAPQTLARLPDGRRIHLNCRGQGSPTVILTSGLGDWGAIWRKVQGEMAEQTRVCAWDRPGFGFSDPSPEPQNVAHLTQDLEQALAAAGIAGPYVLVGHSLGGYESLMFADRHADAVVGMVLVDPSFPGQTQLLAEKAPKFKAFIDAHYAPFRIALKSCADDLASGALKPGLPDPNECLTYPSEYPDTLKAAMGPYDLRPERALTMLSLLDHFDESSALVVNPSRSYRDMPLVVLTATELDALPPDTPGEVRAGMTMFQGLWMQAHDQIAALSTRGVNRPVEGSSHYIQRIKPQVVIDAVREVVAQARAGGGSGVQAGPSGA